MPSSHDYIKDNRNKNIKIFVNDKFYTRNKAKVSVFDSGFLLGDGVWSGIRYHNNIWFNFPNIIISKIPFFHYALCKILSNNITYFKHFNE